MIDLILELRKKNISIWFDDGGIELSYGDVLPDEALIDQLKNRKQEILEFLESNEICSLAAFNQFQPHSHMPSGEVARVPTNRQPFAGTGADEGIEALFAASSLQQGFVVHHLSQPQDDAYRVQMIMDYKRPLDLEVYQQAWSLASLRYPALRTAFDWKGEILQVITKAPSITAANFSFKDLSHLPVEERDEAIGRIQKKDRNIAFDLSRPGLIRLVIMKQNEHLYTLIKTIHHSISDGWSTPVLLQSVHSYYDALLKGRTPKVEPESAYSQVQAYYHRRRAEVDAFWQKAKASFGQPNDISPLLSQSVDLSQFRTVEHPLEQSHVVRGENYQRLKAMCHHLGITLNVALQFAWHKLLQTYTQDEQTIVGVTVSGRDIPVLGIESSVGLYINTLPLAVRWVADSTITEMLQAIQRRIAELNSFSSVSLADLQTHGERLFHSLFAFENYPTSTTSDPDGIESHVQLRGMVEKTDYPLSLIAYEQGESLVVVLKFDQDGLSKQQAERVLNQVAHILAYISTHPDQRHRGISLLDERERYTLLIARNQTEVIYPEEKALSRYFEDQVEQTPTAVALIFGEQIWTYRQLNTRANQLAHCLSKRGIVAGSRVGIHMRRAPEMVAALLAVLKLGALYVPLDPSYPRNRLQYMAEDAELALVLSQTELDSGSLFEVASFYANDARALAGFPEENVPTPRHRSEVTPCYIIYTSGSTGKPKGVMATQCGLLNRFHWMWRQIPFSSGEVCCHKTSLNFVDHVWEIFGPLLQGVPLLLLDDRDVKDPAILAAKLGDHQVSRLVLVPSLLQEILNLPEHEQGLLAKVKWWTASGEALPNTLVRRFYEAFPDAVLLNLYGTSELSADVTWFDTRALLQPEGDFAGSSRFAPIGRPIANTQIFLLFEDGQLAPQGCVGELHVGGVSLAAGYTNEALTAERFIPNPFGEGKLFRTGDLARWLPDGNLEYLGRNDSQVKIRGFRIELGEVEKTLAAVTEVKQAVVVAREHMGDPLLAAYVTSHTGESIPAELLREVLVAKLPDYMIPATFTHLERLPLNLSGKLDRGALPEPELTSQETYTAPRNAVEEQL